MTFAFTSYCYHVGQQDLCREVLIVSLRRIGISLRHFGVALRRDIVDAIWKENIIRDIRV
jgi:hypothetical protein